MRSDYLPEDLKKLWKELASQTLPVSPDDLRRESQKLRGGLRLRNFFVVAVCGVILAAYGVFFVLSKTMLERIGSAMSVAGTANVIAQFLKRRAGTMPDLGATESTRFYRGELARQSDFHRGKGIGRWLLPFLPGPILFNLGFALDRPMFAPIVALQMAAFLMVAAIVVPINVRLARKYERRIDALDASQTH
jgi:hypothetical protein